MNDLKYHEIMWAEMQPDVYAGKTCDQHEPRWMLHADGDMDSDASRNDIVLDPKLFPAGTKVIVSVPLCPECDRPQEACECGFDWKAWTEEQYS